MLKRVLRKKLVLAGALAFSVSLLAPIGVKAENGLPSLCGMECTGCLALDGEVSGNLDLTLQVMGVADLEAYLSLITTNISISNGKKDMEVEGLVKALSKNDQFLMFNYVDNYGTKNEATVSGEVLKNAEGNIGANVVAGDYNAQSNVVAIAAGKQRASLVESKTFSVQKAMFNNVKNEGVTNTASASDNVLSGAKGNIGLNIAAGSNNAQTNQLGIAVGPAKVGMAVAYVQQKSEYNMVSNQPIQEEEVIRHSVNLKVGLKGRASGTSIGGSYQGEGNSYQANNFYPDVWKLNPNYPAHDQHPHSPNQIGHLDMDAQTQGAIANPNRPGVGGLSFDNEESGTFSGTVGAQKINLSGRITGSIPVVITRNIDTVNTASLSGSVLMNAVGNIGVNVAAGSNNLQANTLSVTYIPESGNVPVPPITPGE